MSKSKGEKLEETRPCTRTIGDPDADGWAGAFEQKRCQMVNMLQQYNVFSCRSYHTEQVSKKEGRDSHSV